MLKVQRRHRPPCKRPMWDAGYTKCSCPVMILGTLGRKRIRLAAAKFLPAAEARNLDCANALARLWEREGEAVHPAPASGALAPATEEPGAGSIAAAVAWFLADARDLNRAEATLSKKKTVFSTGPHSLLAFAAAKGLRFLTELDITALRAWRATWEVSPLTRHKRQCSVIGFLWFCERAGYYPRNHAEQMTRALGQITVPGAETGYYEPEEYKAILDATYLYSDRPRIDKHNGSTLGTERLRTVIELMRWTGLRIRDAVTLEKQRLVHDPGTGIWSVGLYQKKTGEWVYCPIPPFVAGLLNSVPASQKGNTNARYFFWTGNGTPKTLVTNWERTFTRFFRDTAAVETVEEGKFQLHRLVKHGPFKRCYAHMFRDTFAVEALLSGMPVETLSTLLGHSSIKVTQDHYMPWVRARQNSLNQQAVASWERQGVVAEPIAPGKAAKAKVVALRRIG